MVSFISIPNKQVNTISIPTIKKQIIQTGKIRIQKGIKFINVKCQI